MQHARNAKQTERKVKRTYAERAVQARTEFAYVRRGFVAKTRRMWWRDACLKRASTGEKMCGALVTCTLCKMRIMRVTVFRNGSGSVHTLKHSISDTCQGA